MGKIGKPQKSNKQKKVKKTFDNEFSRDSPLRASNFKSRLKDLAPENEDDQEIPRKVKNIMKSQQQAKKKREKKKMKDRINLVDDNFRMERGMSRPLKPAPRFVQGPRETDDHFLKRVSLETHRVLVKSQIEDKYKVDITEPGSGRPIIKKQKTEKKKVKEREKKKKKLEAVKKRRLDRKGDFSQFTDRVKFGEVAMEPPSLTTKPRKADSNTDKHGKKNLLLSQYMDNNTVFTEDSPSTKHSVNKPKTIAKRETGKTVKRKFLSPAQQRLTDSQRQRAIDLYRKMKDKKMKPR